MKKLLLLLFSLLLLYRVNAQMYGEYDLGIALKPLIRNSPLMSLHIGYQLNEVFTPNGIVTAEYDQRTLTGGISPVYFGGRIGYGLNTGEVTTLVLSGGRYYRVLSGDDKTLNYWIYGYGLSFIWKSVSLEISKVEFYQISIGCHYNID